MTAKAEFDTVLRDMLAAHERVSDINFTVGRHPQMEVDGSLVAWDKLPVLKPSATERVARIVTGDNESLLATLEATGSCDCAYQVTDGPRFRANVFRAGGSLSIVLRALPSEIPSLEQLGLPGILSEVAALKNGLVLVTGGTGSGKSTTLAAVIDEINRTRAVHIVTLEDPVEFRHAHKSGTINQREQGRDFDQFADGLRAALRQAPKVILVGEMRDRETVEIAMKAAETGHLVLSTLHTIDAGQTIGRIVGMFDESEEQLVRSRLAMMLRFVIGQRLLPKEGGGRSAALEIMGSNMRIRELITNGESSDKTFYGVIAESRSFGWQTFDQHIVEHYAAERVSEETALGYSSDRAEVRRQLDQVQASRGKETSSLGDLEMQFMRRMEK